MTIARMFDASVPPAEPYPGCSAVAGYIGGATPHVWTLEEWKRFGHLRQLPIWVYGAPGQAFGQGVAAAKAAMALGWRAHAEHRRAIVLDMETSTDAEFVAAFARALHATGFSCWVYGSASTIHSLPDPDGEWIADWDQVPDLMSAVAHQYAPDVPWQGGVVDLSVISVAALVHLGRGPRRAA